MNLPDMDRLFAHEECLQRERGVKMDCLLNFSANIRCSNSSAAVNNQYCKQNYWTKVLYKLTISSQ